MHKYKNTSNVVNPIDKTTTRSPEIGVRTLLNIEGWHFVDLSRYRRIHRKAELRDREAS